MLSGMSQVLPLFPLGTVLFPGALLPLHIFEERYRQMMHDLLAQPAPREFAVVAIREGRETGIDGISSLHPVACVAVLGQTAALPDGRFALLAQGSRRARLLELVEARAYLQCRVELMAEPAGGEAAAAAAALAVRNAFRAYAGALASQGIAELEAAELPDDPVALSYLVAAALITEVPARQALLEQPDAASRLAAERALLGRETAMLRSLASAPAADLRNTPYSSN